MVKKAEKKPASGSLGKTEKPAKEIEAGKVTHYFDKIKVAVIEISGKLKVGDMIRIRGNTTDFMQKVDSMQIEHEKIREAKKGQAIGMKVSEDVREHDKVFIVQ